MIYRIFFFLIILGMVTQVIPFIVNFQPTNDQSGITITELSRNLPVTYEIEDYFKAEQFNRPIIPCILAIRITLILGLLALILSGIGSGIENRFGNGRWR
ncbi:MAG: hypothetical protein SV062_10400, partial [Thermodesulfobacteriota bacterium]|nr:hypothetical protein [Thermodesulfobacteriota bacterium]